MGGVFVVSTVLKRYKVRGAKCEVRSTGGASYN
jgi:hypothetical protein